MKRAELLKSEGYWIAKLQTDLYRELISFMERTHKNSSQLAEYLMESDGHILHPKEGAEQSVMKALR